MVFDNKTLIEIGYIAKPHKVNGEILVSLFENIQIKKIKKNVPVFLLLNEIPVPFFIEDFNFNDTKLILKLKHIDSEEDAKKIKSSTLLIFEDEIKKDNSNASFDNDNLENYKVFDKKFGYIGTVSRINFIPGNPVIEIQYNDKLIVLPFAENFIENINHQEKEIQLVAPEGLIEIYI